MLKKKEVKNMKKMKKLIAIIIMSMMVVGFNVVPAEAYTKLGNSVSVTAEGIVGESTATLTVGIVLQNSTTTDTAVDFGTASGVADSGRALEIQAGTNLVDARLLLYTDNESYFSQGSDPAVDGDGNPTGISGAGMPGESNPAYVVPLFWGTKTAADGDPNDNVDYAFVSTPQGDSLLLTNATWVVDKRHDFSFVDEDNLPPLPASWGTTNAEKAVSLDNNDLYNGTTLIDNPDGDGLYPQQWAVDLYDDASGTNLISEALYKNIGTLVYSLGYDGSEYTCEVGKLPPPTDPNADNNVSAKLGPTESLYVYIGGDFRGRPYQGKVDPQDPQSADVGYKTTTLTLEMAHD